MPVKNIKIDNLLKEEEIKSIKDIKETTFLNISNEGLDIEKIYMLNNALEEKNNITINIVNSDRDSIEKKTEIKKEDIVYGFDIIKYIPNIKNIKIHGSMKKQVKDINYLKNIDDLNYLELCGNVLKGIELEEARKFRNLKTLKIENGFTLRQQTFIETMESIEELSSAEFNALSFDKNKNIKKLTTTANLVDIYSLRRALPNLEEIIIEGFRHQAPFEKLNEVVSLKSITIKNTDKIKLLPSLSDLFRLKILVLDNLVNIYDIKNLALLKDLRVFIMTGVQGLKARDFKILEKLDTLEKVSIIFKDEKENREIEKFIRKNMWLDAY